MAHECGSCARDKALALRKDYCSYADLEQTTTTHTALAWTLDLDGKALGGSVIHTVKLTGNPKQIFFDNRGCVISKAFLATHGTVSFSEVPFLESADSCPVKGTKVQIDLPDGVEGGSEVQVRLDYQLQSTAAALDWLTAEQTLSKTLPFMYSQCQAINARSLFPCQDSPSVRMTYSAVVRHRADVTVLLSALPAKSVEEATQISPTATANFLKEFASNVPTGSAATCFYQPQVITPYLVAICAGCIASKDISSRCRVYAEPALIDKAAAEFVDTETFLKTAEGIAGPYRWGRYDLVVLPPSFPYGGMENPNLTFVTPSIVCGDRSGVDVVAHEICHSWSGNLVGTATWSDFFLNEGFTVLLQRKISKALYGRPFSEFEGISGRKQLEDTIRGRGETNPFTALRPDLSTGADPEDIFSCVPYEKGYALLRAMESRVGENEEFNRWLTNYFNTFAGKSITGYDMRDHFLQYYAKLGKTDIQLDWEAWFSTPGLPIETFQFDTSARDECTSLAKEIVTINDDIIKSGTTAKPVPPVPGHWRGTQRTAALEDLKSLFLESGASPIASKTLEVVDESFGFSSGKEVNSEPLCAWYQLCLVHLGQQSAANDAAAFTSFLTPMKTFLAGIGRMKFIRPLYKGWAKVSPADAKACFTACESMYHNIARKLLRSDLQIKQ